MLSDESGLTADDLPTVNIRDRALVYRLVPEGDYYWEFPEKFTGNKVRCRCFENPEKICISKEEGGN